MTDVRPSHDYNCKHWIQFWQENANFLLLIIGEIVHLPPLYSNTQLIYQIKVGFKSFLVLYHSNTMKEKLFSYASFII